MDKKFASRLGFWAAVIVAALGVLYLLLLIYMMVVDGFSYPPSQFVQLGAGIITFLTVQGLVVLFTAIRFVYAGDKTVLGSLGVSFSVLFAGVVSINRFVQFTVIQQSLPDVPADLLRFLPYAEGSVMLSLEVLGWGFFSSMAAIMVAPLFSASKIDKSIRWLFLVYAFVSLLNLIGFVTKTPIPVGPIAWGPILLAICILLAVHFRQVEER